jgi:hypothetical protein
VDTEVGSACDIAVGRSHLEPYSSEWWRGRSPEELRDIVSRGFAGGDVFTAATAELARRSDEARRFAEHEAAAMANFRRRSLLKRRVLLVLLGLSLLATFFFVMIIMTRSGVD